MIEFKKKHKKTKQTLCLFFVFTKNDMKLEELENVPTDHQLIYFFYERLLELKDITGKLDFPKKVKFTSFSLANNNLKYGNEEFVFIMEFNKDKVLKISLKEWLEFFHVKNVSFSIFQKHDTVLGLKKRVFENALVKFESVELPKPGNAETVDFLETQALSPYEEDMLPPF